MRASSMARGKTEHEKYQYNYANQHRYGQHDPFYYVSSYAC